MAKDLSMPTARTTRAKTKGWRSALDEKLLRIVHDRLPWRVPPKDRSSVWKQIDVAMWLGELPQFNARSRFTQLWELYERHGVRSKVEPAVLRLLQALESGVCPDPPTLTPTGRKSSAQAHEAQDTGARGGKRQRMAKADRKKKVPDEEKTKTEDKQGCKHEEEEEEEEEEEVEEEEDTREDNKRDVLTPSRSVSSGVAGPINESVTDVPASSALVSIGTRPTFDVIVKYLESNRQERVAAYQSVANLIAAQERDQTLAKKYLKFLAPGSD